MQAVVDDAGQITIPKDVRDRLGLAPGQVVDVVVNDPGSAIIRKVPHNQAEEPDRFERMRGSLTSDMTTDEIMAMLRGEI